MQAPPEAGGLGVPLGGVPIEAGGSVKVPVGGIVDRVGVRIGGHTQAQYI